ncbi:MAG: pyridoxal-phosphate dependent enzyme [Ardenticatenales bacterium]|nr:pyridoxal-phosphate dependent enzyme [Ardenticatenales bacterium]
MTTLFNAVTCLECGHRTPADAYAEACPSCGSAWLDAGYDLRRLPPNWPALVRSRVSSMWRYTELLPFGDDVRPLSMGEGWTPLTRSAGLARELGYGDLWIKDERQQPTGSFKDRQAAAAVTALAARGTRELVIASTGNAAAAYAAFCARAGIRLWVFLTSSVPAEKMRELALYGAEVVKITGTYDQAKSVAADFAARRGFPFDRGAKMIPGKEAMKTVAYEIVEQLGWRAPDWYVQAVSGGIGPLGVHKGFGELFAAGLIDRIPRLGLIQSEGCSPMVRAWERGEVHATPVQPDTLITVLATGDPGPAYTMLKSAIDRHGGAMVAVSDGDAFRAMRRVARAEGFSVEPAASVAFAGLEALRQRNSIAPDATVVVNCSGHTFSAEKHALEDRYTFTLDLGRTRERSGGSEGLGAALEGLDEQVTTVVVIDDNPDHSRLIRRLLQRYRNYRVLEAHNGPDGLDLVRQRRADVVLLDLMMPGMDGTAILEALKSDGRTAGVPVIVVSAKTLEVEERRWLEARSASIWQKGSFSAAELVEHVVATVGRAGSVAEAVNGIGAAPSNGGPPNGRAWDGPGDARGDAAAFGDGRRPSILVIDGFELDARLLRRLFESSGRFTVTVAPTAAAARLALARARPDLIIMDLSLPDADGEDVVAEIADTGPMADVPLVIVSSRQVDPRTRARLSARADAIWTKETLDRSSLLAHVETILLP